MATNQLDAPRPAAPARSQPRRSVLRTLAALAAALLILGGVGVFGFVTTHFVRQAAEPRPAVPPHTMADVNWSSPDTSVYCLSCHWNVGLATAGLDVQRGHSHNVVLNETQLRALQDMGTIAGPGDTLICLSCHTLEPGGRPFMLADTLADSRLCQRCHPGHYARHTPHDLRESAPDERNRRGQTAAEGGPCSACHLAHSYAREIIPSPLDPDGWCITCHRAYGVAAGHARTDVMHHPESHCLQCHDSHDATHGDFLKQAAPQLCLECHSNYGDGAAAGMHPLGTMERPIPEDLLAAGARAGAGGREITCETCHSIHAAPEEKLLVRTQRTNALCLACHAEPLEGRPAACASRHGQGPVLDEIQQGVVARWGAPVGDGGELLCVSCHRVHGAAPQVRLLTFRPTYGETCIACHPAQAALLATPHDLRGKFPTATNKAGLTPRTDGACSACHLTHQFAREPVPGPGDATGQCLACHLAGRIAGQDGHRGVEHPDTGCTDCHNPHDPSRGRYLAQVEEDLCARCHAEQTALRGGPHDLTRAAQPERWDPTARAHGGVCLSCHVPHGGDRPDLFRVAAGAAVGNHDEICLTCHQDTAWNAPAMGAIHPQHISPGQDKVALALVPRDVSGELRMGCRTCHDPHGGAVPVHLARVGPGESTESLCLHCHEEKQYIQHTGHAAAALAELGFDTDSCKPCHAMHADRNGTWGQMLSPRFLPPGGDGQADAVACLACHRPDGPAPLQPVAEHPPRMMAAVGRPSDPGHLPLFNALGLPDPQGQIVCRTCHLSHGRLDLLKVIADNPEWTEEQQHALRVQLRPFVEPNTCTPCHGDQSRLVFLRFHDPTLRGQIRIPTR